MFSPKALADWAKGRTDIHLPADNLEWDSVMYCSILGDWFKANKQHTLVLPRTYPRVSSTVGVSREEIDATYRIFFLIWVDEQPFATRRTYEIVNPNEDDEVYKGAIRWLEEKGFPLQKDTKAQPNTWVGDGAWYSTPRDPSYEAMSFRPLHRGLNGFSFPIMQYFRSTDQGLEGMSCGGLCIMLKYNVCLLLLFR